MRQGILLLIALWSCGVMASEGYRFTLQGRSDIDQEILVSEVVSFHRYVSGTISLQWYLNDADDIVGQLKQRLITAGVPENSIRSEKIPARENRTTPGIVTVLLRPGSVIRCVSCRKVIFVSTVTPAWAVRLKIIAVSLK